ncbi:MFS transporter [Actinokineospora fastidiosa]|uniref:MFS transporter n=1 Tax=Actinokineospora fastidiosa TaxID=1816 RepID=A0A918GP77_9PSEU|nr:MFS transporter [Actinokineospora fastidiosa]GGS49064.1 MFS transporter [Actinokineospora fastidiosa]
MYLAASRARQDTGDPATAPGGRRVAGAVIALGSVSLVTDVSSEMVTAVLPLYLVIGLGLSPLQFGLLDGLYNGATALVRLAGGHAADRWRRHKLVAGTGYALSALSRLGLLAATPAALSTAIAADRVGKGIRTAPRDALITLHSAEHHLGRAFGVHRAMDTTGAMLGPLVAFALLWLTAGAYDAVFVVSFCIGALGLLILIAFVPGAAGRDTGSTSPAAPRSGPSLRSTLALVGAPGFRRVLLAATLLGLVSVTDGFLYLVLQDRLDIDTAYFPLLPLGSAAVYLVLAVPLGRLADRIGRRTPFLLGHLALLGAYAAVLVPVGGPVLVLLLHGIYYAATDGVLMALGGPLVPRERRAGGLALLQTGQATGRLLASVLFGAAWTAWGMTPALVAAACALAVGLGAAAVILRDAR